MRHYDVIIVGLGSTGGTLANLLALNGFSILILEREKNLYALPRAVHFDDEIMRVFQTIGITKKFLNDFEDFSLNQVDEICSLGTTRSQLLTSDEANPTILFRQN